MSSPSTLAPTLASTLAPLPSPPTERAPHRQRLLLPAPPASPPLWSRRAVTVWLLVEPLRQARRALAARKI